MPAEPRRLENHHFGSVFKELHEKSGTAHKTLLERQGLEHNIESLVRFYAEKRPKFFAFYVKKLVELKEVNPLVNLILHFRTGNKDQRRIALNTFKSILAHDKALAREILEKINDVNSKHYLPEPRPERVEPERKPSVGSREPPAPARARERVEEPGSRRREIDIENLLEPQPGEIPVEIDTKGRVIRKAPEREGPQELELDADGNLRPKGPARQKKERSPIQEIPPEVLKQIRPHEYEQLYGKGKRGPDAGRAEPEKKPERRQLRQEEYDYENEIVNGEIVRVPRLKQGPGELHKAAGEAFHGVGLLEIYGPQTPEVKERLKREREEIRNTTDVGLMTKKAQDIYSRVKTVEKRMYKELEELVLDLEGSEEGKKILKKIAKEHKGLSLTNRLIEVNSLIIKLKSQKKKERGGPTELGELKRPDEDKAQDLERDWFLKPDKDGVVRMPDLREEPGVEGPEEKKQEEKKGEQEPSARVQENRSKRIEQKLDFLSRHIKTKDLEKKFNSANPEELEVLEQEVNFAIENVFNDLDNKLKDYLTQQHNDPNKLNKPKAMYENIMKRVKAKMTLFEQAQELERVIQLAEKGKAPLKEKRVDKIEEYVDALLALGIYNGKSIKKLEGMRKKARRTIPGFRYSEREIVDVYNDLKAEVGNLEKEYSDQIERNLAGADKDHPLRAHFEEVKKHKFVGERLAELKNLVEDTKNIEKKETGKDKEQKMSADELKLRNNINSYPDSEVAYYDFGLFLYNQGRFSEAEQVCRKAVELAPEDPLMHNLLGLVLRNLGRLPEAEESFRKALELDPSWDFAQKNLTDVIKRQKLEPPVEQKKEADVEEPKKPAEEKKAEAPPKKELDPKEQQRRAEITTAIDLNYRAIDFFTEHGLPLPITGSILKKEFVLEELERNGFQGKVVEAHFNMLGKFNRALLSEVAKLRPTVFVREGVTDEAFLKELGIPFSQNSYMAVDSLPKIMDYYEKLKENVKPENMGKLSDEELYELNLEALTQEQAAKYAEQLGKRMPDNYPFIDERDPWNTPERLAAMKESNKLYDAMTKKLKRAKEIAGIKEEKKSPDEEKLTQKIKYTTLGSASAVDGRYDLAEEAYRHLLELLDPKKERYSYSAASGKLGEALEKQGKLRDANLAYTKALELDPKDDLAKGGLARVEKLLEEKKSEEVKKDEKKGPAPPEKPINRFKEMTVDELKVIDPVTLSYEDALKYRERILDLRYGGSKDDPALNEKSLIVNDSIVNHFSLAHIKQKYGATEPYKLLAKYIEAIRPFDNPYYGENLGYRQLNVVNAIETLLSYGQIADINRFRQALERFIQTYGSTIKDPEKFLVDLSPKIFDLI